VGGSNAMAASWVLYLMGDAAYSSQKESLHILGFLFFSVIKLAWSVYSRPNGYTGRICWLCVH